MDSITLRGVRVNIEGVNPRTARGLKKLMEIEGLLARFGAVIVTDAPGIVVHKKRGKMKGDVPAAPDDGILHVTLAWLDMLREHRGGPLPHVEPYAAYEYSDETIARMNDALRAVHAYALEQQLL
jgi:hypothetical protein